MYNRRASDNNPSIGSQFDAALDRVHSLIAEQGKAFNSSIETHTARVDAQFAAQNVSLGNLAVGMATVQQKVNDVTERIFGGAQPGAVQYLNGKIDAVSAEHDSLVAVVAGIRNTQLKDKAWIVGAATAAGLLIKLALAKVGIKF